MVSQNVLVALFANVYGYNPVQIMGLQDNYWAKNEKMAPSHRRMCGLDIKGCLWRTDSFVFVVEFDERIMWFKNIYLV